MTYLSASFSKHLVGTYRMPRPAWGLKRKKRGLPALRALVAGVCRVGGRAPGRQWAHPSSTPAPLPTTYLCLGPNPLTITFLLLYALAIPKRMLQAVTPQVPRPTF